MTYNCVTLDAYSQLSPYLGEQQGWYAQVLLDKFNVKLNFINDSSGKMYNKLEKSGEYGDFDYHPDIRWDLYEQIGMPEVTELEDYIDVLKQMKEICPVSDSGKETYGVSFFSDWDGDMVMYVKSTCTNFFGMDEFGIGLYDVTNRNFEGSLDTAISEISRGDASQSEETAFSTAKLNERIIQITEEVAVLKKLAADLEQQIQVFRVKK